MRICAIHLAALLVTACAVPDRDAPAPTARPPIVLADPATGVMAVTALGARNVRVLYVRPPSIVLMREVFVPAGHGVTAVRFAGDGDALIVETDAERFALDTHTWRLAPIHRQACLAVAAARQPG
jgi:hypothetical protein